MKSFIFGVILFLWICTIVVLAQKKTCHLREVDLCIASMLVSGNNPSGMVPTNDNQLTKLCNNVRDAEYCLFNYTKRCSTKLQRETVKWISDNSIQQFEKFCAKGSADRKEYLSYAPCLGDAMKDRAGCGSDARNALEKLLVTKYDKRIVGACCTYRRFEECAIKSIEKFCGSDAIEFGRKMIRSVVSKVPDVVCQAYSPSSSTCKSFLPPPGWKPEKKSNSVISRLLTAYGGISG